MNVWKLNIRRDRSIPVIHLILSVILYVILKHLTAWSYGDAFWESFLTWRLPLLMGSSSLLVCTIAHTLPKSTRIRFLRLDALFWLAAPIGVGIHCTAPGLSHPRTVFAAYYLSLFALKSALLGILLVTKQTRKPVSQWIIFIATLWFFACHAFWQAPVHSITGDEPHYLMMTHSLVNDADLNLFNDYRDKAYASFYPGDLMPKPSDEIAKGQIYSRGLGATFPAMLIPAFLVGDYQGVQGFITLCAALLMSQLYGLLLHHRKHPKSVLLAVLLIASSMPVITYASLIYPDIPAALLIVVGLRLLQIPPLSKTGRSVPSWMLLICIALIFLKFRYFVPVALLLIPLVIREHKARGNLGWFTVSLATFGAIYFSVDRILLGGDLFANRFGGIPQIRNYLPDMNSLSVLPGLLLDQESGILFYAPVFLLLPAGWHLYKGRKDSLYWFALLAPLFTAISLLGHFAWHCLPTPPLRYLLPVLPPTGLFLAVALEKWQTKSSTYRFLAAGCIGAGWVSAWITSAVPDFLVNVADGSAMLFERLGRILHQPLPVFFPSVIRPGTALVGWSFFMIFLLIIFMTEGRRRFLNTQSKMSITRGIVVFMIIVATIHWIGGTSNVCKYHPEDQWWVTATSGTFFPVNRDPFFHHEKAYGWRFPPDSRVRTPLSVRGGRYSIVARCRLPDVMRPQKLKIYVDDQEAGVLTVSSFDWMDYAFRLPPITADSVISLEAPDTNDGTLAVDFIRLHKVSRRRFEAWRLAAGIVRRLHMQRCTLACMSRALLSFPGDSWYEIRTLIPGAKPPPTEDALAHPLDREFLDLLVVDANSVSLDELHRLEFVMGIPLLKILNDVDTLEYSISGMAQGWLPAARLIMAQDSDSLVTRDQQLLRVAALYLKGNPAGAANALDDLLVSGALYPMRISAPSTALSPDHPVHAIFKDMESHEKYSVAAQQACNRHLVAAVQAYHQSNYRTGAQSFDAYYLSDYDVFLDTVPGMTPDFCVKMFQYANRIHAQHVEQVIDTALEINRPLTALAAANYGNRMFPERREIMYGRARALFHMHRYNLARKVCLDYTARFHTDDRGRWLIEQSLLRIRNQSLKLGSLQRPETSG